MACAAAVDSPPSDCVAADDPQTARSLLCPQRCKLIDRLSCETVRTLADKLSAQIIVSDSEMENIQRDRARTDMARTLLDVMKTRSWAQCVQFARLLAQTKGIEDVGRKLLERAGVLDGQALDCQSLVKEISQLKQKEKTLTDELKIEKQKVKIEQQKTGESRLMETSVRCILGSNYEDTQIGRWKALPHLTQNSQWTVNRVTAVGNKIVAGCFGEKSNVYTLSNGSEQWKSHKSLQDITNVFSYQDTCYVASYWSMKIYKWSVGSDIWDHVTDIPGGQIGFSLTASDEHIYMLGGLHDGKSLNSAAVYDTKAEKWQSLPDMPFTSCCCSSVIINNTLYVGGGGNEDSSGYLPCSEVSSLAVNDTQWRRLPSLRHGRAVITSTGTKLISTGGLSRDSHAVSNVDVFDVISGQWLPLPPMIMPRYRHGVCVTETNSLVAVGGYHNSSCEIAHFL